MGTLLLVLLLSLLALSAGLANHNHSPKVALKLGYLTAVKGKLGNRQGVSISGALTLALEEINKSQELLPNVELVMSWNDTRGEVVKNTEAITDMICEGVLGFIGPEESCDVVGIIAQAKNLPMISYKCSDPSATGNPAFARTEPQILQVTRSVIALLKYYVWKQFSIIFEKKWTSVALSLEEHANRNNMSVNHLREVKSHHECCEQRMICCNAANSYQHIQDTKNRTRIYVFLGDDSQLVDFMLAMEASNLFQNGEYIVITVDMMMYNIKETFKLLWKPEFINTQKDCNEDPLYRDRLGSLLVIVTTPPDENYTEFTNKVSEYNSKEPFNFGVPQILSTMSFAKYVSIYAAYLYDAVYLYANALHSILQSHSAHTPGEIRTLAANGTKIIETLSNRTYKSITGALVRIDAKGESEGNFSVLALRRHNFSRNNFSCDYHLQQIGYFLQGVDYPTFKALGPMEWPKGEKPVDVPSCGFDGEKCPKNDSDLSFAVAVTMAVTLFCASVITVTIYRKWKIELEIEGLLWKIDLAELKDYGSKDMMASPSKLSLASGGSLESRCGLQMFATTVKFKGNMVRIKELKFSKKKAASTMQSVTTVSRRPQDITRDIMKEMRLLRDLRHDNVNSFIGAVMEPMRVIIVTDYCAKGSLYDIIENEDIKLDNMFIASLVHDLIKGMSFLHRSSVEWHGNLKSSNCVVTSRWMLQVTDFGLHDLKQCADPSSSSIGEHQYYRSQFWKAPELLRSNVIPNHLYLKQKADVYAFSIILYELLGRKGPFGPTHYEPKDIVDLVKRYPAENEEPFRPDINALQLRKQDDFIVTCMKDCWHENPDLRPDFQTIRDRLKKMKEGKSRNIMDQMMDIMEKYATNLEDLVNERTRLLFEEKQKTEDLLHRMLPQSVAKRLTTGHGVEPESFDSVTIYFSDIVGFTQMSAESTPLEVVNFLNDLYTVFDKIIKGYDVYKVETIGDAYMVVSGLPLRNGDKHAGEIASMALDLLDAVKNHKILHRPHETLKLRIGIHTGPVVAGVVGLTMPRYCLFGDTVNTASRMESNGEALKIHISEQCKGALDKLEGYHTQPRGHIHIKGKGQVLTYWLEGANDKAIQRRAVDLGELPPLFCRPRRSPKLTDSRHTSFCGNIGCNSRRQSTIRLVEGSSTMSLEKVAKPDGERHNKYASFCPLGSIASSTEGRELCLGVRGDLMRSGPHNQRAHSIDLSHIQSPPIHLQLQQEKLPKSYHSLRQINAVTKPDRTVSILSGNHQPTFINGNAVYGLEPNDDVTDLAEASPLLRQPSLTTVPEPIEFKTHDVNSVNFPNKKWKSMEELGEGEIPDTVKKIPRMHKWILGLLNSGAFGTSDMSLRRPIPLRNKESAV